MGIEKCDFVITETPSESTFWFGFEGPYPYGPTRRPHPFSRSQGHKIQNRQIITITSTSYQSLIDNEFNDLLKIAVLWPKNSCQYMV